MSITNKVVAGSFIAAAAAGLWGYVSRIMRAQKELEVIPKASIFKLGLEGLTIKVDAVLKNPTGASFRIKYPFVKLLHKNELLGSSQSSGKDIRIPSYGEVTIEGIMVEIPAFSLLSTVYDIIQSLIKGSSIKFTVVVVTTVDLGWERIAYDHDKEVTLKK